jgi:hypothetical protein
VPTVVVDTNVPCWANNHDERFAACIAACAKRLADVTAGDVVVLDSGWMILRQYMGNLRSTGEPGVGDMFLRHVLTNQRNRARCVFVDVTRVGVSFAEFPADPELAGFDPADRVFVAVALKHQDRPPVLQALDRGWWESREALARSGVSVEFLCPGDIGVLAEAEEEGRG